MASWSRTEADNLMSLPELNEKDLLEQLQQGHFLSGEAQKRQKSQQLTDPLKDSSEGKVLDSNITLLGRAQYMYNYYTLINFYAAW